MPHARSTMVSPEGRLGHDRWPQHRAAGKNKGCWLASSRVSGGNLVSDSASWRQEEITNSCTTTSGFYANSGRRSLGVNSKWLSSLSHLPVPHLAFSWGFRGLSSDLQALYWWRCLLRYQETLTRSFSRFCCYCCCCLFVFVSEDMPILSVFVNLTIC